MSMSRNAMQWMLLCVNLLVGLSAIAQTTVKTGETKAIGHGVITSWLTLNPDGSPAALWVTMTEGALENLPTTDTEVGLTLPYEAYLTPFTHFALDWNPQGHVPMQFYGVPHFDFHFYLLMPEERMMITATGDDIAVLEKKPVPDYIPQGYIATPGGVPMMGAHWVNPASPEFHGQPFTQTFI